MLWIQLGLVGALSAQVNYTTYLGGSGPELVTGLAADYAGAAYVAGTSSSVNFPVTSTALGGPATGHHCGFVTKFTPDGGGLELSVCIPDWIVNAFAMDPSGAMYLAVTNLDYSQSVVKLDRNASRIVYAVPLGLGTITAIVADPFGAVYVAGSGTMFAATAGAYQAQATPGTCYAGNGTYPCVDAFVAKIDSSGAIVYATYVGGSGADTAAAIAIDAYGDAWITGSTVSSDFPATPNALQKSFHGEVSLGPVHYGDAFVTELDPTGSVLLYSSFIGGAVADFGNAIATDDRCSVYVAGFTQSPDFPVTGGPAFTGDPSAEPGSKGNGFVTKFDFGGNLVFSTYVSSPVASEAVNSERQVCPATTWTALTGDSQVFTSGPAGPGLSTTAGAFQTAYGGGDSDVYVQASAASRCFQAPAR